MFAQIFKSLVQKLEFFFVVRYDEYIYELALNLLLDCGRSVFQFLSSADDLSKLEVDVDAVEKNMEHPGAEIKYQNDANFLIGGLKEGGSDEHKDPAEQVNAWDEQFVLKVVGKITDIHNEVQLLDLFY